MTSEELVLLGTPSIPGPRTSFLIKTALGGGSKIEFSENSVKKFEIFANYVKKFLTKGIERISFYKTEEDFL